MLLQKLMENLKGNPALQNEYIKETFKLEQIQGEADLQDYKNLLNSMAALFYTNHRIGTVTNLFYQWRQATAAKQEERVKGSSNKKGTAAKKLIQIDTELANKDAFKNYHVVNVNGSANAAGPRMIGQKFVSQEDEEEPSEIPQGDDVNMMIHIEGDDQNDILNDEEEDEILSEQEVADLKQDRQARKFIDELLKVGPFSKQILNYSYPPLLYQRGDGEDDEDDDNDGEEDEEDDDAAVRDILEGGAPDGQLPDFVDEFDDDDIEGGMGGLEDEEDREIQELLTKGGALGGAGIENE